MVEEAWNKRSVRGNKDRGERNVGGEKRCRKDENGKGEGYNGGGMQWRKNENSGGNIEEKKNSRNEGMRGREKVVGKKSAMEKKNGVKGEG